MRYIARIALGMVLFAATAGIVVSQGWIGCSRSACGRPLKDYCKGDASPYDRQLAKLEADFGSHPGFRGPAAHAASGAPSRLGDGFEASTMYFDRDGQLVGVSASSDVIEARVPGGVHPTGVCRPALRRRPPVKPARRALAKALRGSTRSPAWRFKSLTSLHRTARGASWSDDQAISEFVPAHVNLMRWPVKRPGQP